MMHSSCKFLLFCFGAAIALGSAQAQTAATSQPGVTLEAVTGSKPRRDGIDIQAGSASLRITALRDDILRVRIAPGSTFPEDASWAVLSGPRSKSVDVQPMQDAASVGFRTAALDVRVERNPLRLVVRDLAGNVISADAVGRPTKFQLGGFSVYKTMPADEHYFGLGDKTGTFDRRNQAYTLWNTDIGTAGIDRSSLQEHSLFSRHRRRPQLRTVSRQHLAHLVRLRQAVARRLFLRRRRRPARLLLHLWRQLRNRWSKATPTSPERLRCRRCGLSASSSRATATRPESQIREIADRLRADKIPSDVLYLDIDYQDRNRPFTVNPKTFPNFPGLVSDLRKQHFHLVTITDLHIAHAANQGYTPYDTGEAGDHFVKNPDGSEFVGIVWPGPGGLSRLHSRADARLVGRPLQGIRRRTASPASGTT